MKLYILLAIIVLFAFFSNDFGLVDIQKTAIILAAAIDKTENGYSLTAQIAVPKGSDRTTGGTSSVEIEAEGATVSDCVTRRRAGCRNSCSATSFCSGRTPPKRT